MSTSSLHAVSTAQWIPTPAVKSAFESSATYFIRSQIFDRAKNFVWIPATVLTRSVDAVGATIFGALSILCVGRSVTFNAQAGNFFFSTKYLGSDIFAGALRTLNPRAQVSGNVDHATVSSKLYGQLFYKCDELAKSENWFVRNGVARVGFLVTGVAAVVSRAVDTFIGLIWAVCAVGTGGSNSNFNTEAYNHLNITALPGDLYACLLKFINPWARGVHGVQGVT